VSGATLRVEALSRSFGGVVALFEVSFQIEAGSIHALIGPNGAGKTTLINIVSGMYRPDAGRIFIDGAEAEIESMHSAAQRGVVRTFQTLKLFGEMTVLEHVLIGMTRHSRSTLLDAVIRSRRARKEAGEHLQEARALLHLLGIAHLEQMPANSLAYGHRRLLEIARALAVRPRLLLLDEPAAGLVAEEIRALAAVIRKLKQAGMTILLVEHHMELVLSVSDRITVLDHGAVIAEGRPADIRRNERVIAAYLGPTHAAA
jgi:branched-chain amino acid transport system permease protein